MLSLNKSIEYLSWIIIISAVVFVIIGGIMFIQTWQSANESAYLSCLGGVGEGIRKSEAKNKFVLSNNWKILTEEETDFLMSKIQAGDCSNFDNPTLDLWNHKINIALRSSANFPNILVWSNGQDGISGTNDDIVLDGHQIPK